MTIELEIKFDRLDDAAIVRMCALTGDVDRSHLRYDAECCPARARCSIERRRDIGPTM